MRRTRTADGADRKVKGLAEDRKRKAATVNNRPLAKQKRPQKESVARPDGFALSLQRLAGLAFRCIIESNRIDDVNRLYLRWITLSNDGGISVDASQTQVHRTVDQVLNRDWLVGYLMNLSLID